MAVSDAYATVAQYKTVFEKTVATEDAEILDDLKAVSRYLDRKLNRFFTVDAASVARTYMPRGAGVPSRSDWAESENPWKYGGLIRVLHVDDIANATIGIKIDEDRDGSFADEVALAVADYELLPR